MIERWFTVKDIEDALNSAFEEMTRNETDFVSDVLSSVIGEFIALFDEHLESHRPKLRSLKKPRNDADK